EVRGPVERVDEPARVEVVAARLLPEHREDGLAHEQLTDRLLAREIGFAHPVTRRLLPDVLESAEVVTDDVTARVRGPVGSREQLAVVELAHAMLRTSRPASSGVAAAMSWRRASIASVTSSRPATSHTTAPASMHAR